MVSSIKSDDVIPVAITAGVLGTVGFFLYNYRVELLSGSLNGMSFSITGSDALLISTVAALVGITKAACNIPFV